MPDAQAAPEKPGTDSDSAVADWDGDQEIEREVVTGKVRDDDERASASSDKSDEKPQDSSSDSRIERSGESDPKD